jgi:hypothetical protein
MKDLKWLNPPMTRLDIIKEKADRIRELRLAIQALQRAKDSPHAGFGLIPDVRDDVYNLEFWTVADVPKLQALIQTRLTELQAELQVIKDTSI